MSNPSVLRTLSANLAAAALYAVLAQACLTLAKVMGPNVASIWLPAGLALSLLVAAGPRLLPGLWLGYVAGGLWTGTPLAAAAIIGLGSTASAWLGAALCRRLLPAGITADGHAPARFLAIAYGCAGLTGLFGPLVLWLSGVLPPGNFDAAVIVWWLGDALGIVVLAPAVLAWREAAAGRRWISYCTLKSSVVVAATLALAFATFHAGWFFLPNAHLQAALLLPPMIWLTLRCHPALPLAVNLAAVTGLVYGAAGSLGPLLGASPTGRAYALHGFVLLSSGTLLFLAAHIHGVRRMAAAARAGEERFRRVTELTSDWYWEQDADYRFTFFDGPVLGGGDTLPARLLGKRRGELPGLELYGTSWEAHHADLAARRSFVGLVFRYAEEGRSPRYFSISGEPVFGDEGSFAGYRGVGRDVTAEIESRRALEESERQFHAVADATFEGLFIHDYGRIVFANEAFALLVGHPADDIVGRPALDFVAPEEHGAVIEQLALDQDFKHFETIGLHAEGYRFPVEVFGRPFVFHGKPMRIAAIRDIGARRATEAALSGQIKFQRTLLDTIPNPVFYKDRQGRFLGYNRAFAEFFGIGERDYIGKTVLDLVPNDMGRQFHANDEALYANPGVQAYEEPIRSVHGRRDMMVYKDVFKDAEGGDGGLVGVLVDISERKKIEDRLRRFLELSPAAIGIADINGKVLYMNPASHDLFGFTHVDVPTLEAWWELLYPDAAYRGERRAAWHAAVEQALREDRSMLRFEGRVQCRDGRERWVETLASLGEQEIFMIFTDLTEYVDGRAA